MEDWLRQLVESGDLAPKSVRSIGSLLHLIFRQAVKWGYLQSSPMEYVDLPEGSTRRRTEPRTLKPGQYFELLKLFGPREQLAIKILGWLGTRRGEGFGLKWQDLDFETDTVTFRQGFVSGRVTPLKTEASRAQMAIPVDVKEALLAWKKVTPFNEPWHWVFASEATKGARPIWPEGMLANYIQPVAEAAGFGRLGFHTFRHSFVSWGKAALKLSETKELARHADLATTSNIYAGLSLDAKRDAQARLAEYMREEAKKSLGPTVSA
jgi:integrase